jgi:acyl-coenzyme A synthetase/AMP-(fatty) acid ligase
MKYPGVSETVVIAQEDEPGNKRLVGYVVPKHKSAPTSSELRRFLLEWLPEYMVPSFFRAAQGSAVDTQWQSQSPNAASTDSSRP